MAGLSEGYTLSSVLRCFLLSLNPEIFFDFSVVYAKELVCAGCHINMIRLTLGTFLVQEAIDRIVNRFRLEKGRHDQEKSLSKAGRSTFGSVVAFAFELA